MLVRLRDLANRLHQRAFTSNQELNAIIIADLGERVRERANGFAQSRVGDVIVRASRHGGAARVHGFVRQSRANGDDLFVLSRPASVGRSGATNRFDRGDGFATNRGVVREQIQRSREGVQGAALRHGLGDVSPHG